MYLKTYAREHVLELYSTIPSQIDKFPSFPIKYINDKKDISIYINFPLLIVLQIKRFLVYNIFKKKFYQLIINEIIYYTCFGSAVFILFISKQNKKYKYILQPRRNRKFKKYQ